MNLQDYKELYSDMQATAIDYQQIGSKHNNQIILEAIARFNTLYELAVLTDNTEDAETYYNDLKAELFECEEVMEELHLEEE